MEEASHLQILVLMEDFNYLVSVEGNTVGHKQARKFPECVDDNFLIQLTKEVLRGALLGLILS